MEQKPLVVIKCLAYNHEKTIRQCLEGFVKQETDFPFVVIINDDASSDHTADIIKEFEKNYPDIIKPIYQTENQYSKKTLGKIMQDKVDSFPSIKYVAICEGDDYWISKDKLQKQVEFLETHSEYSMCCTNCVVITSYGEEDWSISQTDIDLPLENLIKKGGLYIPTASVIYRKEVKENYPECCKQCSVGDHPLQIMCGLKGKVRYFSEKMVAYRYAMGNSWSASRKNLDIDTLIRSWNTSIIMLEGLDAYSDYQYSSFFKAGEISIILRNVSIYPEKAKYILDQMLKLCPDSIKYANKKEKLKLFFIQHHMSFILILNKKIKGLYIHK